MSEQIQGPYGHAEEISLAARTDGAATICYYLITSLIWHPLWSQYLMAVVTLKPVDGFPPAVSKFVGATHELILFAVNPDQRWTAEEIEHGANPPYLLPINICEQFEATDDEMRQVAELACHAVVNGGLSPETADAPSRIREQWLTAVVKTLAHLRGEEHAS